MTGEQRTITGIIGGGNMARAIVGGLIRSGFGAAQLYIGEPDGQQRELLQREFPAAHVTADNHAVAANANILLLAVKPQVLGPVCRKLRSSVQKSRPLVISIAAGPGVAEIDGWLGGDLEIVRAMPNQPALVDQGISALFANARTSACGKRLAEKVMSAVGKVVWVEEESVLNAVTAVSGSGPAYLYLLLDIMIEAAVELGIEADVARSLVLETAHGSSALALAESEPMSSLIDRVSSPGGTTMAAFERLNSAGVRAIFASAIKAARDRAEALAEEAKSS